MLENSTTTEAPDLTCSYSNLTSITYSIANYPTHAPLLVSINSTSGLLTINAPNVLANTTYSFYINSSVSSISSPVQKLISVTVQNWAAEFCSTCSSSPTNCSAWYSGYSLLTTGLCSILVPVASESAKTTSMTNQVATGSSSFITVILGMINTSSMSNIWSMANQIQI